MSSLESKYSVELVDSSGNLLADLTGRAGQRRIIQSRNEAEEIQWTVDLAELEYYCRLLGQNIKTLVVPNSTEVRIKRRSKYICGGQIVYRNPHLTKNSQTLKVRATGFLNLFKDRYTGTTSLGSVTESFTSTQKTTIASTLITETQALTNGNFGVTVGTLATVGTGDKTYNKTNIKDALQNLTNLKTGAFDFEFTYNKVFNTYARLGSNRPDVVFEWPGNITDFEAPYDGTSTANQILALGQGFGDQAQTAVEENDNGSQLNNKLRQRIILTNGSDDSDGGITNAAKAELAAWSFPYELPTLIVDGNQAPLVTDYGIGDYVTVIINNYRSLENINGLYRVEKRIIDIDENDNENVTLIMSA